MFNVYIGLFWILSVCVVVEHPHNITIFVPILNPGKRRKTAEGNTLLIIHQNKYLTDLRICLKEKRVVLLNQITYSLNDFFESIE